MRTGSLFGGQRTELIIFKRKRDLKIVHLRGLIVPFHASLTLDRQINGLSKAFYCQIPDIGRIRRYISTEAYETLASRLDYDNAVLCCLPSTLMERL